MKTLLVMRHAKSSWKDEGARDHDRSLNARGRRAAPLMGRHLDELGVVPDLILSSTARRARETATLVAEAMGVDEAVKHIDDLYLADAREIVELLRYEGIPADCVMVIGHNPGLAVLVENLGGRPERFPTAAVAHIELPIDDWPDLHWETTGRLVELWRPRELEQGRPPSAGERVEG